MDKELTNGITREQIFRNLKNAGRDDLLKNFERNTGSTINPADLSVQTTPDLPSGNTSRRDKATNDTQAGVFNFEEASNSYLSKVDSGTVTQDDNTAMQAGLTRRALDLIAGKESAAEERKDLNEEFDIEDKTQAITDYQNQLKAEQRSLDLAKRRLNEDSTVSKSFRQGQLNTLEKRSLEKQADIAILGSFAQNDLNTSLALIDNRIELEFGDQEEQWDNFMLQVDAVNGLTSSVSSKLKQDAQDEKDRISGVRSYKENLMKLAAQSEDPAIAQQLMSAANQINENSTIEQAQGVYDSSYSSAVNSGAFRDTSSEISLLSKEEFTKREENKRLQSMAPEVLNQEYETYVREQIFDSGRADFSSTEYKKLAQANLLSESFEKQLDFLYGGSSIDNPFD